MLIPSARVFQVAIGGKPRWKCSADVPAGLAMGLPEVTCEGYDYQEDPHVLTGSCSLLYSLEFATTGCACQPPPPTPCVCVFLSRYEPLVVAWHL